MVLLFSLLVFFGGAIPPIILFTVFRGKSSILTVSAMIWGANDF